MKKILFLVPLFVLLSCSKVQKEQIKTSVPMPKSGIVEYNIQLETKEEIDPADFGTKGLVTFNDKKTYFKKLDGKDTETFQITELATSIETNYLSFRGNKFALKMDEKLSPAIGDLVFQNEKKQIAGFTCQKAIAKMGNGEMVAWITNEIGVNFLPYKKIEGFALQYTLIMDYGNVTYTATKVTLQPVDEKLFNPSSDYKPVTLEELQAELMGRPMAEVFKKGEPIANFDLQDMDGSQMQLTDFQGKVVLINFWFINCPPCRMEMPDLNELKAEYAGKDVEFIAITFDEKTKVAEFLGKTEFDFQIFPDARQAIEMYSIMGFPTSVILNKEGKVVDSKMGGSMNIKEELKVFIEEALNQ